MPRLDYQGRELRLTFCTNVVPAGNAAEILSNLDELLPTVREVAQQNEAPFGVGLWIPGSVAEEIEAGNDAGAWFGHELKTRALEPFTLNGFPFGDFHSERVKDDVFRPHWAEPQRLDYTQRLGRLLALWMQPGETGSISTHTGGHKSWRMDASFTEACAQQFLQLALDWDRLHQETGVRLVLGMEPEPGSSLETTDETIAFCQEHLLRREALSRLHRLGVSRSRCEEVVHTHLGVCFDACHQAVEYEDGPQVLARLQAEGIAVAKLQISSALQIDAPGEDGQALATLGRFAEPRYLHQVGRPVAGTREVADDLEDLLQQPGAEWLSAPMWRVHFHVPVHRQTISGLATTQDEMLRTLRYVLDHDVTRHLEVETYTWGVLPGEAPQGEALAEGLGQEMRYILEAIQGPLAHETGDEA